MADKPSHTKYDPYVMACVLITLLTGHKRSGYKVVDIYTNQQDDVEIIIELLNGHLMKGTLQITARQ